ncbi:MAG: PHP domain-containing protein [Eubacterium sp.]|nr:PHP domain-containing protein [Eubacterium sp.]
MKIDMHCHVHEGSVDSKVHLAEYIDILREKGIGGMLVTDHDTYNGYRAWKNLCKNEKYKDFVVLQGIEYDTLDAGHILVIMPAGTKMRILELRGMPLVQLMRVVHRNGGILGPAHPGGGKFLSFGNSVEGRSKSRIIGQFDFVEGFNACETEKSNQYAQRLALKYGLPMVGGSDAHNPRCVGLGYTEFEEDVRTEDDLIRMIRKKKSAVGKGGYYGHTLKKRMGPFGELLNYLYFLYNYEEAVRHSKKREETLRKEAPDE